MGSETSKPVVEPPEEWEASGGSQQFQVISPCSDLSNPSDIRRVRSFHQHHHMSTPHYDRASRRASKTIAKTMPQQLKAPKEVPEPSAFYFPTKESDERFEKSAIKNKPARVSNETGKTGKSSSENNKEFKNTALAKTKKGIQKTAKVFAACFEDNEPPVAPPLAEQRHKHLDQLPTAEIVVTKTRRSSVTRKSETSQSTAARDFQVVYHAESKPRSKEASRGRDRKPRRVSDDARAGENENSHDGSDPIIEAGMDPSSVQMPTQKEKAKLKKQQATDAASSKRQHEQPSQKNKIVMEAKQNPIPAMVMKAAQMTLHHEDSYFNSLSGGNRGHRPSTESPYSTLSSRYYQENVNTSNMLGVADNASVDQSSIAFNSARSGFDSYSSRSAEESCYKTDNSEVDTVSEIGQESVGRQGPNNHSSSFQDSEHSVIRNETNDSSVSISSEQSAASSANSMASMLRMSNVGWQLKSQSKRKASTSSAPKPSRASGVRQSSYSSQVTAIIDQELLKQTLSYDNNEREDCDSVLSEEDDTYFKPDEKFAETAFRKVEGAPLQQIASLGRNNSTDGGERRKVSKLESLFRPILPALSSDDAQKNRLSYDPFEIKVTESAPAMLESDKSPSTALQASPSLGAIAQANAWALLSPSVVSIDSQFGGKSPPPGPAVVSNQASRNGEYLFSSNGQIVLEAKNKKNGNRGSAMFSISTMGARSRLTSRSVEGATVRASESSVSEQVDEASHSYKKNQPRLRRVRFSEDGENTTLCSGQNCGPTSILRHSNHELEFPAIETKMSDLTDVFSVSDARSSIDSFKANPLPEPIIEAEDDDEQSVFEDVDEEDRDSVYEGAADEVDKLSEGLAEAETKAEIQSSPEILGRVKWSYRTDPDGGLSSVTPALKGGMNSHTTNSPFLRFKAAKSKFAVKNDSSKELPVKASPTTIKCKISSGSTSMAKIVAPKEVTEEHFEASPTKSEGRKLSSSGGVVSNRVQELNQKVTQVKREKRLRKKYQQRTARNPRRFKVTGEPLIRTQTIVPYKLKIPPIAKFTLSADQSDDDSSIVSQESLEIMSAKNETKSRFFNQQSIQMLGQLAPEIDEDEDDELTNFTRDSATVETVRQEPSSSIGHYQQGFPRRTSEATFSTASSGFSHIRKNVFHSGSVGRLSDHSSHFLSDDNSTTLSSIIDKENSTYLPFRPATNSGVKPSQQRASKRHDEAPEAMKESVADKAPVEPNKWRSLAAAAQAKGPTTSKSFNVKSSGRKVFGMRNMNHQQAF